MAPCDNEEHSFPDNFVADRSYCYKPCCLTTVRECVSVRATVDRAVRVGDALASSAGHYDKDSRYHRKHQNQTSYRDGNGETALGHTNRIIRGL